MSTLLAIKATSSAAETTVSLSSLDKLTRLSDYRDWQ